MANVLPGIHGVALQMLTPLVSMMPPFQLVPNTVFLAFHHHLISNNDRNETSAPNVNTAPSLPGEVYPRIMI